jgi:putative nucleotidyltransferase with HDIG domain
MKLLFIDDVVEGMILAEDIYDKFENLYISSGAILTKSLIKSLSRMDLEYLNIVEKIADDGEKKAIIIEDRLNKEYKKSVESFKRIFNGSKLGKKILSDELDDCINPLLEEIKTCNNVAKRLWQIETCDEYTYDHSIMVCMLSALLGKWLSFPEESLHELSKAGLLHDIGKINIPDEILNKAGELSEDEFRIMKTHPTLGYVLLMNNHGFTDDVLDGVLQHHEKYDGKGYPSGIKGKEIHKYARVVAIADVYAAMIADRVYRKGKSPFEAARVIMDGSFGYLDPYYSMIFLNKVSQFYVGNIVKLTTGEIGEVVLIQRNEPARPLVNVEGKFIDLLKNHDIEIEEIIY